MADVKITRNKTGNGTGKMSPQMRVKFIDNSQKVLVQINDNGGRAIRAVGTKAVGMILAQMESGYGKPIRQTGNLMRDVSYEVVDAKTVNVGNTMEYAPFVHEGTYKKGGRAYIRDALTNPANQRELQDTYEQYLKQGFDG